MVKNRLNSRRAVGWRSSFGTAQSISVGKTKKLKTPCGGPAPSVRSVRSVPVGLFQESLGVKTKNYITRLGCPPRFLWFVRFVRFQESLAVKTNYNASRGAPWVPVVRSGPAGPQWLGGPSRLVQFVRDRSVHFGG